MDKWNKLLTVCAEKCNWSYDICVTKRLCLIYLGCWLQTFIFSWLICYSAQGAETNVAKTIILCIFRVRCRTWK